MFAKRRVLIHRVYTRTERTSYRVLHVMCPIVMFRIYSDILSPVDMYSKVHGSLYT